MASTPGSALIVDCHNIGWVAAYAFAHLKHEQEPTGVLFGFLQTLLKASEYIMPDYILFAWDSQKSRRRRMYESYKRKDEISMSEEEAVRRYHTLRQLQDLRTEVLPALGLHNHFMHTGFEADDVMASLVKQYAFDEAVVISSDNDMLQILTDTVSIYNIQKKELITKIDFIETYGIEPEQWAAVKTLAGCSSDNVPGVPGVGEGKALQYLKGTLPKAKVYQRILDAEGTPAYERDKKLVTLPLRQLNFELHEDIVHTRKFITLCKDKGFFTFLKGDVLNRWKRLLNMA